MEGDPIDYILRFFRYVRFLGVPPFVMLTVSTLFAQDSPQDLDALIDQLRTSPPVVAPRVLPTLPNQGGTESPDYGAKYSSIIQIDCDGVRHQVSPAQFGAWAEQMLASRVREARVVMPYNPHGDEGVELWKLGQWPELEVLNLKDFKGKNVVRTGPRSWTTRGAVRAYPSVRRLWVYYGMRPSFGRFPNLEEVWFAENDKGAGAEAKRLEPSVKTHTYGNTLARPIPIPSYFDLREDVNIATITRLTVQGPPVNKDLSELAKCTELRELLCHYVDLLVDLRSIAGLKQIETLELVDCGKLRNLAGLEGLTNLKKLSIIESGAKLRSEDFKQLANLEFLRLSWCDNLVDLNVMPDHVGLRYLDLSGTKVTDFTPLRKMKNLQVLCLDHAINLSELGFLRNLPSVRRLVITNCPRLSLAQIREIQAALPECAVHFDFRS